MVKFVKVPLMLTKMTYQCKYILQDGAGSQVLLSNAERFGYILASTENEAEILIMRQNIGKTDYQRI